MDGSKTLSESHQRMLLVESGLTESIITQRGYYTETVKTAIKRLGFVESQLLAPSLVIPICWAGEVRSYQIRPDNPRVKSGRILKYESASGVPPHLDCHPSQQHKLTDALIPLWITEGVKKGDAMAMRDTPCIALSGVESWRAIPSWSDVKLRGRRVFIAYDSDVAIKTQVMAAMDALGKWLKDKGADVRYSLIPSPDGSKVGLDDFLKCGGTIPDLVVNSVDELPVRAFSIIDAESPTKADDYAMSESGVLERVLDTYGNDIRYCHVFHRWLIWVGTHWDLDETNGAPVMEMIRNTIRTAQKEALNINDELRLKRIQFYLKMENYRPIDSVMRMLQHSPSVSVLQTELDCHPNLINVLNGTYDTKIRALREHRREDLLTQRIRYRYIKPEDGADDPCQKFSKFLDDTFQGNTDLIEYVVRTMGYSLTGFTSEKKFWFCHGYIGDNGKTVLFGIMGKVYGDYACTADPETFLAKAQPGGIPNDIARLRGKRVVLTSELQQGRPLNEALIKRLTGSDPVTARFMRAEYFDFQPVMKVWMMGNYQPEIRDTDPAIWKRVSNIPFQYSVPVHLQNKRLKEEIIEEEAEGVLALMFEGLERWLEFGLGESQDIDDAVSEYKDEMDVLGEFLRTCTQVSVGGSVQAIRLYKAYTTWATANGLKPMTNALFGRKITSRGIDRKRTETGKYYQNIALLGDLSLIQAINGEPD